MCQMSEHILLLSEFMLIVGVCTIHESIKRSVIVIIQPNQKAQRFAGKYGNW